MDNQTVGTAPESTLFEQCVANYKLNLSFTVYFMLSLVIVNIYQ